MGLLNWLFRKSTPPAPAGSKRYAYPTGNVELAIRVERGEPLLAVLEEIRVQWRPGNEHLWDDYDPESLLDTPEKGRYLVNALLFGRLTVYRALRAAGQDVRGRDPLEVADQVPEALARLRARFPSIFGEGAKPEVNFGFRPLKLSPGDPGLGAADSPGQEAGPDTPPGRGGP